MPDVRDCFVDLRGLPFHYRDWGGNGPEVLLLHGLSSNCHIWDLVAPLLARRFQVVGLDQRGHGDSSKPDEGYDFATVLQDLLDFIAACGLERPLVVGHSWGANVALALGSKHPEAASGLVWIDGGFTPFALRPGATWEQVKRDLAPPDLTRLTMEQLVARARERRWGDLWRPEVETVLRHSFDTHADGTIRPRLRREWHMQALWALWEQGRQDLLPTVRLPVLLLPVRSGGSQERRGVSKEQEVAGAQALLPRARTVWLEDSIHDVPLQRPERVATAICQAWDEGFFRPEPARQAQESRHGEVGRP
ncbi:MAG: alpha/beta hydrolase [Chloroflexi bacterium]|nr:alpha/beta hydrolase [Chloroflexota bacterium]